MREILNWKLKQVVRLCTFSVYNRYVQFFSCCLCAVSSINTNCSPHYWFLADVFSEYEWNALFIHFWFLGVCVCVCVRAWFNTGLTHSRCNCDYLGSIINCFILAWYRRPLMGGITFFAVRPAWKPSLNSWGPAEGCCVVCVLKQRTPVWDPEKCSQRGPEVGGQMGSSVFLLWTVLSSPKCCCCCSCYFKPYISK